jgi:hypothetical protein
MDAKPPLFSSDKRPENSRVLSSVMRNCPSEIPPITLSFTEIHCWTTDSSEKSIKGFLIGSEAIPKDHKTQNRVYNGSLGIKSLFMGLIFISFQRFFSNTFFQEHFEALSIYTALAVSLVQTKK